jgi:hypothetical protein
LAGQADVDLHVAPGCPTQLLQCLAECPNASLRFRFGLIQWHEHADAPHPFTLLATRCERPHSRCATENGYEVAPPHCAPEEHAPAQ